jgi:hypothetical protein
MKETLSIEKSKISITYGTGASTSTLASRISKATLNTKNDFILGRIMMLAREIIRISTRIGAACALFSILAWGQPALTTISDVLFRADATRFNGVAQITWLSFDSATGASIAQQSTTVRIIDGNLFIKLTPTSNATPMAQYLVLYESDGKIQFQETWNVTPSTTSLRLRDVRTAQPLFPITGGGGAGGLTAIQESDVTGLVADLTARAVKGPGFSNSRTAIINDVGQIEAAIGTATDCVHVDGTSGACGGGGGGGSTVNFVDGETPGGVVDGSNANFTLVNIPSPVTSLHVFRNGLMQKLAFDYTFSGSTITFVGGATPQPGDTILAEYRH